MPAPYPELQSALSEFLDRLDAQLRLGAYAGEPIAMYLAGGLAVNYYCGTRYTGDIDASFSRRILIQDTDLVLQYRKRDGSDGLLYFDRNYNPLFGLLHEHYAADSLEWTGIGNERRLIQLRVLSPVDLAVSKVSRFSEQDRLDIRDVARATALDFSTLQARARQALLDYVGNPEPINSTLRILEADFMAHGLTR
jgi:hypothetical protein